MAFHADPNLRLLESVADRLGPLLDEVMLVGGCAAGLLVTDPAATNIRATLDVDLVVDVATHVRYERFGQRLEQRGFRRSDRADDPVCRWRFESLILDVMPLDESILGFSSRWYGVALRSRIARRLRSGATLHHIDGPLFIATKLEAFASRGEGDFVTSHDLEDMVLVIDGRAEIEREIEQSAPQLRAFIAETLAPCLADRYFVEALAGYFPDRSEGSGRARRVLDRMRSFTNAVRRDAG